MRFYAIVLITWAAIAASLESNVTKFNNEKVVTEFRDVPAKQIAQSYLENVETKNSEKMGIEDHSDHNVNAELSSSDISADERESSDAFTSNSSPSISIYSTPFTKTIANYPFRKHLNYESKHTVPEDILLVTNAGNFGQKVWESQSYSGDKATIKSTTEAINSRPTDKYTNFQKSFNSSVSLENEDNREELDVSITHEPFVRRRENISDNLSSDNSKIIEDPNTKNFDENFDVRSITENSPLGKTNVVSFFENMSESLLMSQAGSSGTYHDVADKITKKSTELVKSVDRTSTSVEISPVQVKKFSAPIVVPDLPDREDLSEDVVDYLDDNDASKVFKSVENAKFISKNEPFKAATASNGITSSIMLNPLQVGITLMNADETDLTDNSEQSAAVDAKDYFQNNLQRLATVNEEFANQSRVDCKNENFQCDEKDKSVGVVTQKIPDNSVEIQKSVELYYAAPVHEIHYPAEYIQSSNLDITKTNNALQKSKQQYDQGNHQVNRNIVKTHAFVPPQKHNRHGYNALKDDASKTMASALIAESTVHEQTPYETVESQSFKYNNNVQPVKPSYTSSTYREQSHLNNPFRSSEIKRPETPQLLLKIIPEGSSANDGFLVPIPQPYPIEKIVEKTVHAPHSIEIEKVIEKKVPIPVQVAPVSQPYHVRVQVPVDHIVEKQIRGPHLYPIYIEKRIPYMVKRLQTSAYPQHMKLPAAYSIEKSPSHVPIEKVTEKPAFSLPSRPSYRANTDRPIDNNGAIETKFNKYQHKLRESVFIGENANSRDNNAADGSIFEPHQSETNTSQFYSDLYSGPFSAVYDYDKNYYSPGHLNAVKLMILPKKYNDHIVLRPHVIASSYTTVPRSFKRQIIYNLLEKDKATIKDMGLTSPRKTTQDKTAFSQMKFSPQFATQISAMTATLRRSRQPEAQYTGNFRQSKMEYGFKPPMIPSVQYDEKTGSKVEN